MSINDPRINDDYYDDIKGGHPMEVNTDETQCPACRAASGDEHVEGCRKVMFDHMTQQQEDS